MGERTPLPQPELQRKIPIRDKLRWAVEDIQDRILDRQRALADKRMLRQLERNPQSVLTMQEGQWIVLNKATSQDGSADINMTKPTVRLTPSEQRKREDELTEQSMQWIQDNPGALAKYENNWVAMNGEEIVAVSSDYGKAAKIARKKGYEHPLFIPVNPPDTLHVH